MIDGLEKPKAAPAASIVGADILAAAANDAANVPAAPSNEAAPAAPGAAPGRVIDYAAELRDLGKFAAALMFPICPSLRAVYTAEVCASLHSVGVPLLQKYQIDLSLFGPELAFAIVALPLVAPTIIAIKHDRANGKNENKANEEKPQTAPAGAAAVAAEEVKAKPDLDRFPGLNKGTAGGAGSPFAKP
jgi:hypothetical protein